MPSNKELYAWQEYSEDSTRAIQGFYVPFFKGRGKVLDIACGRGEFIQLLKENGVSAVGVDIEDSLNESAKAAGVQLIQADVFEFLRDASPGSFDGMFMSHFLEHLSYDDIQKLFDLCAGVIKDGGILVVAVPSVSSIGMHLDWFYRDPTHIGFRHPETIAFLLAKTGFTVQEKGGNQAAPTPYLGEQMAGLKASEATLRRNEEDIAMLVRELSGADDDIAAAVKTSLRSAGGLKNLIKRIWGIAVMPGVKPYVNEISRRQALLRTMYVDRLRDVNEEMISVAMNLAATIDRIDHSFEDFVVARKGNDENG